MKNNKLTIAIAAVVVVIAFLAIGVFVLAPSGVKQSSSLVALQLTDPPQVPSGANALTITYSSVQVQTQSGWIPASGTGSVNLLAVVNLTQTIGTAEIPNNSQISSVRFNITSATITVNGTTYNVTVPSGSVTAKIVGGISANDSILLSLSPVVATIVTNTTSIFVMVPSVKAVIVPNSSNSTSLHVGARVELNEVAKARIEESTPNITISNVSISVSSGNVTAISMTVKDNSNSSVVLRHIGLFGNESVRFNTTGIVMSAVSEYGDILEKLRSVCNSISAINTSATPEDIGSIGASINSSLRIHEHSQTQAEPQKKEAYDGYGNYNVSGNISQNASVNSSHSYNTGMGSNSGKYRYSGTTSGEGKSNLTATVEAHGNVSVDLPEGALRINASYCSNSSLSMLRSQIISRVANFSSRMEMDQENFRFVLFTVDSNGTLTLPSSESEVENSGLTLQSGQSAVLHFSGVMFLGNGHLVLQPVSGANYSVRVQGEEGAHASANVTAK